MLTEKSVVDKIEILEMGEIWIRRADRILKDGNEVSKSFHRHVIIPGDKLKGEDARVVLIAKAVWTTEVIETYKKMIETLKAKNLQNVR